MSKKMDTLRWLKTHVLRVLFFLAFLEGIITVVFLLQTPSETAQSLVLGFSLTRLGFAAINFFIALFFLGMGIYLGKKPSFEENLRKKMLCASWLLPTLLVLGAFFFSLRFLIPSYYFSDYFGYVEQVYPTLFWFFLIAIQTFIFLYLILRNRKISLEQVFAAKPFFLLFAGLLVLWMFIAQSGLGIIPDDRYWNEAGVPLLNQQILLSGGIAFLVIYGKGFLSKGRKRALGTLLQKEDILLVFLLWGVTAFLWVVKPLPKNFFAPGPYLPTGEIFPYADAVIFDVGGQFALLGQGIFNGAFIDRALLSGFLAILHLIVGQNYEVVIAVQTILFAGLVPVLYLLGTRAHSRLAGLFLAILFLLKGLNAIALSTLISTVNTKFMLTELATGLLLALFTLWLLQWYQDGKSFSLVFAGGAIGLGIMLRTHLLILFPLFVFLAFLKYRLDWKKIVQTSLILAGAFLITVSPWMWRSNKIIHTPFFFLQSFRGVMEHRYPALPLDEADLDSTRLKDTLWRGNVGNTSSAAKARRHSLSPMRENSPFSDNFMLIAANHFSHNLITSFFMLPMTPVFHDLRHTVRDAYPYWNKQSSPWNDGRLTPAEKIGVGFNLLLISLGFYAAWKKWGAAAWIPAFVFLFYHVANAVARTSGGRYLVPVDWVLPLYYVIGWVYLISYLLPILGKDVKLEEIGVKMPKGSQASWRTTIFKFSPFFFLVLAITLIDQAIPRRYDEQFSQAMLQQALQADLPFSQQDLEEFINEPNAVFLLGRGLYPRFYTAWDGEPAAMNDVFGVRGFSRFSFTLLGSFGNTGVMLPIEKSPSYFPNASDVIVWGCRQPGKAYVDAILVVLVDYDQSLGYLSSAAESLSCEPDG